MLGRGAMSAPWLFREIKEYLATGIVPEPMPIEEQWAFIKRHCALAVAHSGEEPHTIAGMRSQLMAYSRGMPAAKQLREQFSAVSSLADLGAIAASHIAGHGAEPSLALS
jgi:tRNA-dihydrouridine synthase